MSAGPTLCLSQGISTFASAQMQGIDSPLNISCYKYTDYEIIPYFWPIFATDI